MNDDQCEATSAGKAKGKVEEFLGFLRFSLVISNGVSNTNALS